MKIIRTDAGNEATGPDRLVWGELDQAEAESKASALNVKFPQFTYSVVKDDYELRGE